MSTELEDDLHRWIEEKVPPLGIKDPYSALPHTLRHLLPAHLAWLQASSDKRARGWLSRLKAEPEGAAAEAMVRGVLLNQGALVELGREPPDFHCRVQDHSFDVECTAVRIETASKRTRLRPEPAGPAFYQPLNRAIFNKLKRKSSLPSEAPLLLVVGTFHFMAAIASMDKMHVQRMVEGDESLFRLRDADGHAVDARQRVSAILLLALSVVGLPGMGVLNPEPKLRFDPSWLQGYEFLRARS